MMLGFRTPTGSQAAVLVLFLILARSSTVEAAPPGSCLPDPGGDKVYLCDPLQGKSEAEEVQGGEFVGDGGWRAWVRADGLHYSFGKTVGEGHLSYWITGLGDSALPNNDHILQVLDNGPWVDKDTKCRWAEIKIWGVVDPGQGTIFNVGGNFCGGPQIVGDHDHSFYDPSKWYHVEIEFDGSSATWRLDDSGVATVNYDCGMTFTDLWIPKRLSNQAEDPPIGATYANVSFVGTAVKDPCEGTEHCSNQKKDCEETQVDCGGACSPCAVPKDASAEAAVDAPIADKDVASEPPAYLDAGGIDVKLEASAEAKAEAKQDASTQSDGGTREHPNQGYAVEGEDSGCACALAGAQRKPRLFAGALALAIAAVLRARRKRCRA